MALNSLMCAALYLYSGDFPDSVYVRVLYTLCVSHNIVSSVHSVRACVTCAVYAGTAVGVVVYSGRETRSVFNTSQPRAKVSKLDPSTP